MTVATILVVTLLITPEHRYGFQVPFESEAACIAAIPAMDPILAAYPDAMVQCIRTTVVTASPFPKHRPEELK